MIDLANKDQDFIVINLEWSMRGTRLNIGISLLFIAFLLFFIIPMIGLLFSLLGVVLIFQARRNFGTTSRAGGFKGTVKNLRVEGNLTSFWLELPEKRGEYVPVEARVAGTGLKEGDVVWVKGSPGNDGILRTTEVRNLSRVSGKKVGDNFTEDIRKGSIEFAGVVLGEPYELDVKRTFGQELKKKIGFRVQRVDAEGNPIDVVEVEVKEADFKGMVYDRDSVWIKGKWTKDGRVRAKIAKNLTTKSIITRRSRKKLIAGVILIIALVIFVVLFAPIIVENIGI